MLKNEVDEDDCANVFELYRKMLKSANFEVSTPSTYIERGSSKCVEYLKSIDSDIRPEDLYERLKEQSNNVADYVKDFGGSSNPKSNWKYRNIIEKVKETGSVKIINRKPLRLAYDHKQGSLDGKNN